MAERNAKRKRENSSEISIYNQNIISQRNKIHADIIKVEGEIKETADIVKGMSANADSALLVCLHTEKKELKESLKALNADVWIRENQQDVENFFLPHDTCLTSYIREKYNLKAICMIGNELLSEEEKAAHVCELPTSCDDPICIYTILEVSCVYNSKEQATVQMDVLSTFSDLLNKLKYEGTTVKVKCGSEVICDYSNRLAKHAGVVNGDVQIHITCSGLPFATGLRKVCNTMKPASTYASSSSSSLKRRHKTESELARFDIAPCTHRDRTGHHVSIYCPVFSEFTTQCENVDIDRGDCLFAHLLCDKMKEYYSSEEARQAEFVNQLMKYFPLWNVTVSKGGDPHADIYIGKEFLVEVKNEPGSTTSDPFPEVISYYVQGIRTSCSPAFIATLDGTNFTIYGAVYSECLLVDMLTPPVWMVDQYNYNPAMERIARVLKSLKLSLTKLRGLGSVEQSLFPYLQKFKIGEDEMTIRYTRSRSLHMFKAYLEHKNRSEACIVKFCESYGTNVHRLLFDNNLAPELFFATTVGHFTAVVTREIDAAVDIKTYLASTESLEVRLKVRTQCLQVLACLKEKKFVHGDLRSNNILVNGNGDVKVVDFDWAGCEEKQCYPFFMNHVDIDWPNGATDGQLILSEHDEYWIHQLFT